MTMCLRIVAALTVFGCLAAVPVEAKTSVSQATEAALTRGEQIYARCAGCHAIEANRTGPQHCGLFGRRAGTAPGFDTYSKAMRDSKIVWNERSLDTFLAAPTQSMPGTTMGYAGVKDARERADLLAWLRHATRPGDSCRIGL